MKPNSSNEHPTGLNDHALNVPNPPRPLHVPERATATNLITPPLPHVDPEPLSKVDTQDTVPHQSGTAVETPPPPNAEINAALPTDFSLPPANPDDGLKRRFPFEFHLKSTARSFAALSVFIALVAGGASLLNTFVFRAYYVSGQSMQPTLHDGDNLIVSVVEKTRSELIHSPYVPHRGDIVVISDSFLPADSGLAHEPIIKRVVGLPGETIAISDDGKVRIHNSQHPDGFDVDTELGLHVGPTYVDRPMIKTIPENTIFVMGDNRSRGGSYDSRIFGPLDSQAILGRLWVRTLPLGQVRVF